MASFYQQFFTMMKYLVNRNRMSVAEQSQAFFCRFRRDLLNKVLQRLQPKFPDHHPDDPYTLAKIYTAAQYALQGMSILFKPKFEELAPVPEGQIKNKDLYKLFKLLSSQIVASGSLGRTPELQMSPSVTSVPPALVLAAAAAAVPANPIRPVNNNKCNFCGEASHFIYKCPVIDVYIQQGLASRNAEGKVVLPTGIFMPGRIKGNWLKDRIDLWHQENPGQQVAAQLSANADTTQNATLFFNIHEAPTILQ